MSGPCRVLQSSGGRSLKLEVREPSALEYWASILPWRAVPEPFSSYQVTVNRLEVSGEEFQCQSFGILAKNDIITNMSIDIEWEDPPAGRRREDFTAFANELRANPGRWAKWPKLYRNSTSIGAIRKNIADGTERAPVGFRDAYWDAVVRNSVLYVRYLGDTQVEAEETLARDE